MSEPLLQARGLVKRYGGLVATDHLDFSVALGETCGVIGPNGAGLAAPERARAGIGRTYQIPRPFLDMSVGENLQVAFGPTRPRRELLGERLDILRQCGLADCADLPARSLPPPPAQGTGPLDRLVSTAAPRPGAGAARPGPAGAARPGGGGARHQRRRQDDAGRQHCRQRGDDRRPAGVRWPGHHRPAAAPSPSCPWRRTLPSPAR